MTLTKYIDIEDRFFKDEENNIVCLTETHKKVEDIYISRKIKTLNSMRKKKDKKGGGIQILMPKMSEINLEKKENNNKDLLEIEGKIFGMKIKIIIVYFDANKNKRGKDRNIVLKDNIETIIENNKMEGLMIMGDFNGHIKEIDGRNEDDNGKMILKWTEKYKLKLLNLDEKCEGKFTRVRGEQKTTIDYVLVNEIIYERFDKMHIDEEKEIIEGSDHTLISVSLNIERSKNIKKAEWKEITYYLNTENEIESCIKELENKWKEGDKSNLQKRIDEITEQTENKLKKKKRIKIEGERKKIPVENKWVSDEIKKEIKKRREINRRRRHGKTKQETDRLTKAYNNQKLRVQRLVKEAKNQYEIKITTEIKQSINRGKDTWRHINKLSGRKQKDKDILDIYENGEKLGEIQAKEKIKEVWGNLFKAGRRELTPIHSGVWGPGKIEETMKKYEIQNREAREKGEKIWILQPKPRFKKENWEKETEKLKKKKAAGTTRIKAETYKKMAENQICSKAMIESLDGVLDEKDIPECWKISWMKLIKKINKPTAKDLRPITITNISYKIYMSFLRKEVEKHLEINGLIKDNQTGFSEGGRPEYNHFILQYLVERAHQKKEKLIVIALDFKKAFDSIDRRRLIEALIEYRINPYIIDLIAKIYSNDKTKICIGEEEIEIDINTGVKQGCTASTVFFKIITYIIMSKVEEKGIEYEVDGLNISTLFFADDSMALAKTEKAAKKNLEIIIEESKKFGLEINKEKSNIIIFNDEKDTREIDEIAITEKIKYLGLMIDNKKDMFKSQKKSMIEKAEKFEPNTYSTIKTSCNKMLIGKSYWKGIVIPTILYGAGLYNVTKKEITNLQTKENDCYRTILGAKRGTATSALRGEIGSSLMDTRFIESRLMLVKSILEGKNKLLKEVLKRVRKDKKNIWNKRLEEYLKLIHLKYEDLIKMSYEEIKRKVKEKDNEIWKKDLVEKNSLGRYRKYKTKIKQEDIYDNRYQSVLLFKLRTGTLELNIEKRHKGEDTTCDLCRTGEETDIHFMLECNRLDDKRNKKLIEEYKGKDKDETLEKMLFRKKGIENVKKMINDMWRKREIIRKKLEKEKKSEIGPNRLTNGVQTQGI